MSLLSFAVAYSWQSCDAAGTHCRAGADRTAAPFAARRYTAGHADTGRRLRLTETAAEVVQTQREPVHLPGHPPLGQRAHRRPVRAYPRHRAPATAFVNGTPERAHRLGRGVLPGGRAARQRGRRHRDPAVPGRRAARGGPCRRTACSTPARCGPGRTGWRCAPPTGPAPPRSASAGRSTRPPRRCPVSPGARASAGPRRTWTAPATRCAGTGRSAGPPRCSAPGATRWTSTTSTASSPPGPRSPRSGPAGRRARWRTRARSATSTWPGRTTARTRTPGRRLPGRRPGQHVLRLPRGALGRPAPARRAQADAARARRHVRAEGVRRGRAGRHRQLRPAVHHRLPPHPRRRAELPGLRVQPDPRATG